METSSEPASALPSPTPRGAFVVGVSIHQVQSWRATGRGERRKRDKSDLAFVTSGFLKPGGLFSRKPYE